MNMIQHNLPMSDYRSMDGLSKHQFDWFCQSPAYYAWRRFQDFKASRDMILGTLIHAQALEGRIEYAVCPPVDRRTKVGKETWEAFCHENAGKEVVTEDEGARIEGAVLSAEVVLSELGFCAKTATKEQKLWVEASLCWDSEQHPGLQFKGRPDLIIPPKEPFGQWTIVDLKTTSDFFKFGRKFWDLAYDRQAAWYSWGLSQLGKQTPRFVFAVVDTEQPHFAQLMEVDSEDLARTHARMHARLSEFWECHNSNEWPGPQGVHIIKRYASPLA